MKKNKTMRVAAAMAVLALLSTCLVSGTFAKYTTSGESHDSARVAKFGVEVTGQKTMFSDQYGQTVKSEAAAKVVAPGTEGKLDANTITGKPEVSVRVSNEATVTLANWADEAGKYYCPLEVTVGQTTIKGTECSSMDDFKGKIEAAVAATSKDYAPNTDIAAAGTAVSWKWEFEGNNDANDTYLGDQANATFGISVTTTVTQID